MAHHATTPTALAEMTPSQRAALGWVRVGTRSEAQATATQFGGTMCSGKHCPSLKFFSGSPSRCCRVNAPTSPTSPLSMAQQTADMYQGLRELEDVVEKERATNDERSRQRAPGFLERFSALVLGGSASVPSTPIFAQSSSSTAPSPTSPGTNPGNREPPMNTGATVLPCPRSPHHVRSSHSALLTPHSQAVFRSGIRGRC